ncbi:hypothetical protein KIV10_11455 [Aequorivita echinoideorum]|uniref:PH domain-containing protein n=2 Tax=Aequorivita echinoideorum TaxID=1549647 RepID=A0ABS5S6J5_9FLAO|nr:hypothetical protein [Aequorivita echinoideorum]
MDTEFTEVQKFTQWWLWLLLVVIGISLAVGVYQHYSVGGNIEENPDGVALISSLVIILLVIGLFKIMKLQTSINKQKIHMRFFPFINKSIKWDNVKHAEVVNYGFVGGWGIRIWTRYGTVYNVKGNKGLALELTSGKRLLIGTQKSNELARWIKTQA